MDDPDRESKPPGTIRLQAVLGAMVWSVLAIWVIVEDRLDHLPIWARIAILVIVLLGAVNYALIFFGVEWSSLWRGVRPRTRR
jgi:hypothetical protein